ncbi:hypothetical protein T23_17000 [Turicibacter faecis]|uniref:LPXTG cell wall anchor domain-containing protein n=1 Tax=Turicibacter faecis TaxID=2963365 RepID=A0ABN6ZCZ4_9FIRM|nr:hypothetical protein T23_17000 [Turicibacter sp. TC023]
MKKLAVSTLAAVMVASSFGVVADASTTDVAKLRDQLVSLGVPANDANQLITYLQSIQLSTVDQATLKSLVDQAYSLIGDRTDLRTLSTDEKNTLMNLASQAASKVGLVLKYDVVNGIDTVTLVTAGGQQILSLTDQDIASVLQNFDGSMISFLQTVLNTTLEVVIGSNVVENGEETNRPSVTPIPDAGLGNTGFEMPTTVMAGAGLVVLAAGLMMFSKREIQE